MRNVLVTGASTGLGEASALRLARSGWRVFAGVRKDEDGERLRASNPAIEPVRLDVTDEADISAAAKLVDEAVGPAGLTGLVNNAGVARGGPIEYLPMDEWRDQFEVNVIGHLAVTKALLPAIRRAAGRVVFMGSISGRVSIPLVAPYGASKHALEAIAESLRHELGEWGIKVVLIEPGAVKTPIWAKGREYTDDIERRLGREAVERYRSQIEVVRKGIDESERRGIPAERVAEVVEKALTAGRPRPRYLVGPDARLLALVALLPDRLRDPLVRKLGRL